MESSNSLSLSQYFPFRKLKKVKWQILSFSKSEKTMAFFVADEKEEGKNRMAWVKKSKADLFFILWENTRLPNIHSIVDVDTFRNIVFNDTIVVIVTDAGTAAAFDNSEVEIFVFVQQAKRHIWHRCRWFSYWLFHLICVRSFCSVFAIQIYYKQSIMHRHHITLHL